MRGSVCKDDGSTSGISNPTDITHDEIVPHGVFRKRLGIAQASLALLSLAQSLPLLALNAGAYSLIQLAKRE